MYTSNLILEEAKGIVKDYLSEMGDKNNKENWDKIFQDIRERRIFMEENNINNLMYYGLTEAGVLLSMEQIKYFK